MSNDAFVRGMGSCLIWAHITGATELLGTGKGLILTFVFGAITAYCASPCDLDNQKQGE